MPALKQTNTDRPISNPSHKTDGVISLDREWFPEVRRRARQLAGRAYRSLAGRFPCREIVNQISLRRYRGRSQRRLEIGPGPTRIEGFETLNIRAGRQVDYIFDASRQLPFSDGCFEIVYASHVLEHVPWYQTEEVLQEWVRILQPGGVLEVWVPDGLKVCRTLIEYEDFGRDESKCDGWYRFNPQRDVCKWAAGRVFSYGDGTGRADSPNWHRALFTSRYLSGLLGQAGLTDVREMDRTEVRGSDHGWINLGVRGTKP